MPGSPPTRVTEPGTRPPPSTRSSSEMPVARADHSCTSTSEIGTGTSRRAEALGDALAGRHVELLDQGVPLLAAGAAPHPLGRGGAALAAPEHRSDLGHPATLRTPCDSGGGGTAQRRGRPRAHHALGAHPAGPDAQAHHHGGEHARARPPAASRPGRSRWFSLDDTSIPGGPSPSAPDTVSSAPGRSTVIDDVDHLPTGRPSSASIFATRPPEPSPPSVWVSCGSPNMATPALRSDRAGELVVVEKMLEVRVIGQRPRRARRGRSAGRARRWPRRRRRSRGGPAPTWCRPR